MLTVKGAVYKLWLPNLLPLVILLLMAIYSIAVGVGNSLTYSAARKQSREFAPRVAQALKNDRIEEAVNISDKHQESHLAAVVGAGLQVLYAREQSGQLSGAETDASKRALQRAVAHKSAEFRHGLTGLATIGSTAWMLGLLGLALGLIQAVKGASASGSPSSAEAGAGILNGLLTLAFGLAVTLSARWMHDYFAGHVEFFTTEMNNAASELIDYLLKYPRTMRPTP